MTVFVLDASVTMRWLLETDHARDQQYAWATLETLADDEALVPDVWHLEVGNVLLNAEREKLTAIPATERFIEQLASLPIRTDTNTSNQAFSRTLNIARSSRLSSYDAAYLELAIREGIALATLDRHLRTAARKFDVEVFAP